MTTILVWLSLAPFVGCFAYVVLVLISERNTIREERASSEAAWALIGARDLIQQREHDTLDPRPVLLWAHEDCARCSAQTQGHTFRRLRHATQPIPGDSRRR